MPLVACCFYVYNQYWQVRMASPWPPARGRGHLRQSGWPGVAVEAHAAQRHPLSPHSRRRRRAHGGGGGHPDPGPGERRERQRGTHVCAHGAQKACPEDFSPVDRQIAVDIGAATAAPFSSTHPPHPHNPVACASIRQNTPSSPESSYSTSTSSNLHLFQQIVMYRASGNDADSNRHRRQRQQTTAGSTRHQGDHALEHLNTPTERAVDRFNG